MMSYFELIDSGIIASDKEQPVISREKGCA